MSNTAAPPVALAGTLTFAEGLTAPAAPVVQNFISETQKVQLDGSLTVYVSLKLASPGVIPQVISGSGATAVKTEISFVNVMVYTKLNGVPKTMEVRKTLAELKDILALKYEDEQHLLNEFITRDHNQNHKPITHIKFRFDNVLLPLSDGSGLPNEYLGANAYEQNTQGNNFSVGYQLAAVQGINFAVSQNPGKPTVTYSPGSNNIPSVISSSTGSLTVSASLRINFPASNGGSRLRTYNIFMQVEGTTRNQIVAQLLNILIPATNTLNYIDIPSNGLSYNDIQDGEKVSFYASVDNIDFKESELSDPISYTVSMRSVAPSIQNVKNAEILTPFNSTYTGPNDIPGVRFSFTADPAEKWLYVSVWCRPIPATGENTNIPRLAQMWSRNANTSEINTQLAVNNGVCELVWNQKFIFTAATPTTNSVGNANTILPCMTAFDIYLILSENPDIGAYGTTLVDNGSATGIASTTGGVKQSQSNPSPVARVVTSIFRPQQVIISTLSAVAVLETQLTLSNVYNTNNSSSMMPSTHLQPYFSSSQLPAQLTTRMTLKASNFIVAAAAQAQADSVVAADAAAAAQAAYATAEISKLPHTNNPSHPSHAAAAAAKQAYDVAAAAAAAAAQAASFAAAAVVAADNAFSGAKTTRSGYDGSQLVTLYNAKSLPLSAGAVISPNNFVLNNNVATSSEQWSPTYEYVIKNVLLLPVSPQVISTLIDLSTKDVPNSGTPPQKEFDINKVVTLSNTKFLNFYEFSSISPVRSKPVASTPLPIVYIDKIEESRLWVSGSVTPSFGRTQLAAFLKSTQSYDTGAYKWSQLEIVVSTDNVAGVPQNSVTKAILTSPAALQAEILYLANNQSVSDMGNTIISPQTGLTGTAPVTSLFADFLPGTSWFIKLKLTYTWNGAGGLALDSSFPGQWYGVAPNETNFITGTDPKQHSVSSNLPPPVITGLTVTRSRALKLGVSVVQPEPFVNIGSSRYTYTGVKLQIVDALNNPVTWAVDKAAVGSTPAVKNFYQHTKVINYITGNVQGVTILDFFNIPPSQLDNSYSVLAYALYQDGANTATPNSTVQAVPARSPDIYFEKVPNVHNLILTERSDSVHVAVYIDLGVNDMVPVNSNTSAPHLGDALSSNLYQNKGMYLTVLIPALVSGSEQFSHNLTWHPSTQSYQTSVLPKVPNSDLYGPKTNFLVVAANNTGVALAMYPNQNTRQGSNTSYKGFNINNEYSGIYLQSQ
jgi:hypothetical protein